MNAASSVHAHSSIHAAQGYGRFVEKICEEKACRSYLNQTTFCLQKTSGPPLKCRTSLLPLLTRNPLSNVGQDCRTPWGRKCRGAGRREFLHACAASFDKNEGGGGVRTTGRQRKVEKVLTATRIGDEGSVRIMGPGTDLPEGFGPFLSLDEFFLAPSQRLSSSSNAGLLESLVYFLEDPQPEPSQSNHPADDLPTTSGTPIPQILKPSDEVDQPRHGMQLFFRSAFQPIPEKEGQLSPSQEIISHWPIVNHGREAAFVPESREGNGAEVNIIAGGYGRVTSGPPLDRFQMLDVTMRRDSHLDVPLGGGALVYILEGVGLFGGETSGFASASYQNEGHALWLPASRTSRMQDGTADADVLHIRTNKMSSLRFLLLSEVAAADTLMRG